MFADVVPDPRIDATDATFVVPLVAFVVLLLVLEVLVRIQRRRELARVRTRPAHRDHVHAYGVREPVRVRREGR